MHIEIKNKACARFKLITRKGDKITKESAWSNNRVLTSGLIRMGVGTWINRCCIGTGNSEATPQQTQLNSFLASTVSVNGSDVGFVVTEVLPYYFGVRRTWRFAQGTAAGNISEVGMGWGDNQLWNRALVRDSAGNPTTLTVLSDEILDIVAEIRCYPSVDFSGSFLRKNKQGEVEASHTYIGTYQKDMAVFDSSIVTIGEASISASAAGNTNGSNPGGTTLPVVRQRLSDFAIRNKITAELNVANFSHRSLSFGVSIMGRVANSSAKNGYKIQIDPPYTKTASVKVTYIVDVSWGEYVT